jgi:hypothetical protein
MCKHRDIQQHPLQAGAVRLWMFLALAVVLFLTTFQGNRAYGQLASGTINGTVTDSQGNAIVGAAVSVKNTATQVVTAAKTGSDGSFQAGALVLGPYEVTFEATGFQKIVETNIRIEAASVVRLDEKMVPGAATTTIEVDAQGAALETETIATSTTLEEELVQNEPVVPATGAFRDATMLVNLTPGASGSFVGVMLDGGRAVADEVLIDGVPQLFAPLNTTGVLVMHPSFDVVSQVYTQPGTSAPEFGRSSGGVVTELTKSGTSQYHGDAQCFFRNSIFDARAYNSNSVGKDEQYELPVSFGGPVWIPHLYNGKKRTFFFFNFTRFWNESTLPTYGTIPTLQERTGDFSDQLAAGQIIYDPTTEKNGVRQPFPGNKFAPTSAIMQQFLNAYPKPTNGALTNNILYFGPNGRTEAHWFYRIDHNITDNNSIHWTFAPGSADYYQPTLIANNIGYTTNQLMSGWDDWTVTPNLFQHFVVSAIHYNATNTDYGPQAYNYAGFPSINVPGTYPLGRFAGMPASFGLGSYNGFGVSLNPNSEWTYDYQDSVVWTKAKHSLKFGVRYDALQANASNPTGLAGSFNFGSGETGIGPKQTLTSASAGNPIASALLGYVDNGSTADNVSSYGRSKYFAVYAQDSWRITPKLTANYGIRWEMQTPIIDAKGNMSTMDPTVSNSAAGGLPGAEIYAGSGEGRIGNNSFLSTWKDGYGPRLGLAYDLGRNMVVRAGYGLMYAPYELLAGWFNYPGYDQRGFSLDSSAVSPDGGYTPAFNLDKGFPAASLITSSTLSPTLYNGQSVTMWDKQNGKDNRLQDNQTWQLDLQKQFGSWYIDAGYVGQRGHHIDQMNGGGPIFNQVHPSYLALGSLLTAATSDSNWSSELAQVQAADPGFKLPFAGFSGSVAQALRPYPQFTTVSSVNYPSGSSSWDGFLVKVQKNYKNGFSLLAAYTWSKEFSNAGFSQFWLTNTTQDTYNSKGQKSLGEFDIPQNLQLSYIYELPFGKGKQFINSGPLSYFAGGFGISVLQSYESGSPIRLYASAPALPLFNPQLFLDIVPGVQQKLASRGQTKKYNSLTDTTGTEHGTKWLNEDAFKNPDPYTLGTSRAFLDHLHQLAVLNENLAFFKRTPVNADGSRYIELRAEMFNAFNRQNFGGLDTTLGDQHFGEYTGEFSNLNFGVQPGPKITEMEMRIIF